MMKRPGISFIKIPTIFLLILILFLNSGWEPALAGNRDLISEGEKSLAEGDLDSAEKIFTKAVETNPEGYRAMKSLAEIKFDLGKYEEAIDCIDKLLDLQITGGRNILVYMDEKNEPLSGELIDETVEVFVSVRDEPNKFMKAMPPEIKEHYRIFFLNEGKFKLLPKDKVHIKYLGIPRVIRDQMVELRERINEKLSAVAQGVKN